MSRILNILFIGLITAGSLVGQSPMITSKLDKDSMYIGESVNYTFHIKEQINLPGAKLILNLSNVENLAYSQDTNSLEKIADIEVLNAFELEKYRNEKNIEIPINDINKNKFPFKVTVNLGIYSIGAFHFPPPLLIGSKGDTLFRNNGSFLFVNPPDGFGQDSTKVINPIKPIIEIPNTWRDYLWILWTLIGVILAIFTIWYFMKRKSKSEEEKEEVFIPTIKEPAHIIAIRKLEILDKTEIWKEGKIKEYQSELTNIIREYLEGRYQINALEMTSTEIVIAIDKEASMKGQSEKLRNILTVADLVKFAKAEPSDDIHKQFLNIAVQFVNQTKRDSNVD